MTQKTQDINENDLIKILVASDIHLGFEEKDPIRGDDSFIAFEEVLQHAVENDVDAILLGGDLFHIANPTSNTLNKCMKLLRTYTLGDKPISLEFLSDQTENFIESLNKTVNYEDPNINVSIPVFSIHGNHDDPSGFGRISSLDLLSTTGLVNYFGKWVDLTKINIYPIMLQKGITKLSLYGLSYISDARLTRLFTDAKVFMEKPDDGDWFNIMVLHQNRADRGFKNYLPEEALPGFLDLVIWGHEHDCRIVPEENAKKKFFVSQPGSTVATSLAEGESIDKHCGLLMIHKKQFKMEPIKMKTIRPFVFETLNLTEYFDELGLDEGDVQKKVQDFVSVKIEEMIEKAKEKISDSERQPKLPLIRLRIISTDIDQRFNEIRFGQQYNNRVANPMTMLAFQKLSNKVKDEHKPLDNNVMLDSFRNQDGEASRAEEVVDKYFRDVEESKQLELFSSKCLSELCRRMVSLEDDDAAEKIVKFYEDQAINFLAENVTSEDNVEEMLLNFRLKDDKTYADMLKMLDRRSSNQIIKTTSSTNDDSDTENDVTPVPATTSRGRGRTAATKAAVTKTATTPTVKPVTTRGRGRGSRGGKTAAASKVAKVAANQSTIINAFSQKASPRRSNISKVVYVDESESD